MTNNAIKARIAPSPTGNLHLGTARTALFNYLYAQHTQGEFILRIEDTDKERSRAEYEENILQGLLWLGLEWSAEFRQSQRSDIYQTYIQQLLKEHKAFYCWHEKHELQQEQEQQTQQKQAPRHICDHKHTTPTQSQINNAIIRFHNAETQTLTFQDQIKGDISFDPALLGDFSIAKNVHTALYNFAVVVDDFDMAITDVIRGEDHISNTPKQILLQKALNFPTPSYAHLPLLLGTDKSKLSKRHGATSVHEYKEQGYLPQAMFNFLCLLGWHPDGDQEIYTQQEIIEQFSLSQVQTSPAIFNIEKLQWMNKQYIQSLSEQQFEDAVRKYYQEREVVPEQYNQQKTLIATQERVKTLAEVKDAVLEIVGYDAYDSQLLCYKEQSVDKVGITLQKIYDIIQDIDQSLWDKNAIHNALSTLVDNSETKGHIFHPLRIAMSGKKSSPPPFDIMEAIGKQESIQRLKQAITLCKQ